MLNSAIVRPIEARGVPLKTKAAHTDGQRRHQSKDGPTELSCCVASISLPLPPKPNDGFKYRSDIDGLRALAVLAVIIFHYPSGPSYLPGGFMGVDVFFVISGYVVAGSLLRRSATTTSEYFLAFYARRLKRLSPDLVLVACATGLAVALFVDPDEPATDSYYESGMYAVVGLANNYLMLLNAPVSNGTADARAASDTSTSVPTGNNYFGRRLQNAYFGVAAAIPDETGSGERSFEAPLRSHQLHSNPFTHTWSLGVEEQFYFTFPALMLLAFCQRVSKTAPHPAPPRARPTLLLGVVFVLGTALSAVCSRHALQLAFFLMPTRLWELLSGAMLFDLQLHYLPELLPQPRVQVAPDANDSATGTQGSVIRGGGCLSMGWQLLLMVMLDAAAAGFLGAALVTTDETAGFPFPGALLGCVGTLCFIAAGCLPPLRLTLFLRSTGPLELSLPLLNAFFSNRACVYIGMLSYPLYLWHWPIFVILEQTAGFHSAAQLFGGTALSLALAMLTYHTLERAVRNWKPAKHRHVYAIMLPALLAAEIWLGMLRWGVNGHMYLIASELHSPPAALVSPMPPPSSSEQPSPPLPPLPRGGYSPPPPRSPPLPPAPWQPPPSTPPPPWPPPCPLPPVPAGGFYSPPPPAMPLALPSPLVPPLEPPSDPATPPSVPSPLPPLPLAGYSPPPPMMPCYSASAAAADGTSLWTGLEWCTAEQLPGTCLPLAACCIGRSGGGCVCELASAPNGSHMTLVPGGAVDGATALSLFHDGVVLSCMRQMPASCAQQEAVSWPPSEARTSVFSSDCMMLPQRNVGPGFWHATAARMSRCLEPIRHYPAQRQLFVIGDSHAVSFAPGLDELSRALGAAPLRFASIGGGCGFTPWGTAADCGEFVAESLRILDSRLQPGDLVFLAMRADFLAGDSLDPSLRNANQMCVTAGCADAHLDFVRSLRDNVTIPHGAKLVLLGDTPMLPEEGKNCAPWLDSSAWGLCDTLNSSASHAFHHINDARFAALAAETPPGTVGHCPLLGLFCPNGMCTAFVPDTASVRSGSILAFIDRDHLSTSGARYMWPFLCDCIRAQGLLNATS